uniref:NADH-ubiquinone oxidoreductase chain 6 n=1 Tax=Paroedura masobe TaxID=347812 RepID=A0A7R7G356_9SAUR|nr:NADH dehydrogenase subunit 6 [Paroedura masobe]
MEYLVLVLLLLIVVGGLGVAVNPAPNFGVVGLVLAAGACCGVLVGLGSSFIGLVLFLVYLGGMLVVFAYSIAVAAEPYPTTWADRSVLTYVVGYGLVIFVSWFLVAEAFFVGGGDSGLQGVPLQWDSSGVCLLFGPGAGFFTVMWLGFNVDFVCGAWVGAWSGAAGSVCVNVVG